MNIQMSSNNGTIKLMVSGSLFVNESTVLREKMLEQIRQGKVEFLLDFSNLDYIDSSGLGVLVSMHKRVKENNGNLVLKGLKGEVKGIFELTRLTRVFEIVE